MIRPPQNENPDAPLDRLLAHLGNSEPSADLNRRLLQRFENREAPASNRPGRSRQAAFVWPLGLVTTAAAILGALSLFPAHHPTHHRASAPATLAVQPSPLPSLERAFAGPLPPRHSPRATAAPGTHVRPLPPVAVHSTNPTPAPEEAQALEDLHAPSQLAPPMPLTAQERAILRLLRRNRTVDLAELDPALRADRDRADQLARSIFFDPPLPPQPQGESK